MSTKRALNHHSSSQNQNPFSGIWLSCPKEQTSCPSPPLKPGSPPIIALYSFKGGVGRTTHLLGLLKSLAESGKSALIVDADLEAPGITFLAEAEIVCTLPDFSFVDFLAVAHESPDGTFSRALDLATDALKTKPFRLRTNAAETEHFLLPAFRSIDQALTISIKPEHLLSGSHRHWVVSELLASLGARLQVDAVLIDLRAGLSEMASPLIFDPRIQRILVTTLSRQSLEGTKIVLGEISKLAPLLSRTDLRDPSIVFSLVIQDLIESASLLETQTELYRSYLETELNVKYVDGDASLSSTIGLPRLSIEASTYAQDLLYINSITDAFVKLQGTSVSRLASRLLIDVDRPKLSVEAHTPSEENQEDPRRKLAEIASDLEFAESGKGDKFLRVAPLRGLARQFRESLPVAVVVGNKGSGKTYTCLQIIRSGTWSSFVTQALEFESASTTNLKDGVPIWPLLQSRNLREQAQIAVEGCRSGVAQALGIIRQPSSTDIEDKIRQSLLEPSTDETWWRHRWFAILAESLGVNASEGGDASSDIIKHLNRKNRRLVVVMDGLEDLFPALETSTGQQIALRALLQGVPNFLRELPSCPFRHSYLYNS